MWRRALRVARSNLTGLADRATSIGRGVSLEDLSDAELEAELERRRREYAARAAVGKAKERAAAQAEEEPSGTRGRPSSISPGVDLSDLPLQKRKQVRQYYANLELPFGADLEEVKHAYRRLMRQYHPDKHQDDPARRQLANQLSTRLSVAYNELRQILKDR